MDVTCSVGWCRSINEWFSDIVLDICPVDDVVTLHELLNTTGNGKTIQYPSCPCGRATSARVSHGVVGAAAVFVVAISRQAVAIDGGQRAPLLQQVAKDTRPVLPVPALMLGEQQYWLKAVVEHLGHTCDGGHYITYVRLDADDWVVYDDERAQR